MKIFILIACLFCMENIFSQNFNKISNRIKKEYLKKYSREIYNKFGSKEFKFRKTLIKNFKKQLKNINADTIFLINEGIYSEMYQIKNFFISKKTYYYFTQNSNKITFQKGVKQYNEVFLKRVITWDTINIINDSNIISWKLEPSVDIVIYRIIR